MLEVQIHFPTLFSAVHIMLSFQKAWTYALTDTVQLQTLNLEIRPRTKGHKLKTKTKQTKPLYPKVR